MNKIHLHYYLLFLTLSLMPARSINADQMTSISDVIVLHLAFSDPNWDGKIIPEGQQCIEFGGNGASPRITVKDIPPLVNELVLEFSDATYKPCDNGGHGVISYQISKGSKEITIPSIPGQTFNLPKGFSLIKEHCGANLMMQPGAYIGPCPGIGNLYYVTVKALYQKFDRSEAEILGFGRLDMGTYKY